MPDSAIIIPSVLNGLTTGALYALVALGLTLIYGVLHIINFSGFTPSITSIRALASTPMWRC